MKLNMTGGLVLLAAVAAVLPFSSAHSADAIHGGQWEFTSQMQMPGGAQMPPGAMPSGMPPGGAMPGGMQAGPGGMSATHRACIDPERAVPTDPRPECRIDGMQRNGATINWSTTCNTRQGIVRSSGVANYRGDTMEGTMTTQVPTPNGATMTTSQRITGRYVGPCTGR